MGSNKEAMIAKLGSYAAYKAWLTANGKKATRTGGSFKDKAFAAKMGKLGGLKSRKVKTNASM